MKTLRSIITLLAAAATLSLGAVAPASAQAAACMSDYDIQAAIQAGDIKSWPTIRQLAGISNKAQVFDLRVCLKGGVPYYSVNVVSPDGKARKIVLNAVDGTP